jgi:hypothetical protein
MKLFFSLFLFSQTSYAGLINIYFEQNARSAQQVQKIFMMKYNVPKGLISIEKKSCQSKVDSRFLNLCVTKKGELIQLPSYLKFIRKSLKTFKRPSVEKEA